MIPLSATGIFGKIKDTSLTAEVGKKTKQTKIMIKHFCPSQLSIYEKRHKRFNSSHVILLPTVNAELPSWCTV